MAMCDVSPSGNATVDVIDAAGTTVLYNIGSSIPTPLNWNYGVLPPGSYQLRVTRSGASGMQPFKINAPPIIQVTDPNETGGEDFL